MLTLLVVLIILAAALIGWIGTRSNTFRVERATRIAAPPEKVFPLINDFHRWTAWSPWEKRDPAMKKAYGGPESGRGATYEWDGNNKVGKGRMEIVETSAPRRVTVKLDFLKPFEGHNTAEFTLQSEDGFTHATWAVYGPNQMMAKVMSLFISMDKLMGKDFEEGLANLKKVAEAS